MIKIEKTEKLNFVNINDLSNGDAFIIPGNDKSVHIIATKNAFGIYCLVFSEKDNSFYSEFFQINPKILLVTPVKINSATFNISEK